MMRRALALVVIGALVAAGMSCSGHRESQGGPAAFREPVRLSSKDIEVVYAMLVPGSTVTITD